ncbi:chromosome segregation protein [Aduncisulcus paluster]|uniref:Chromosome segregation protein n=1 Tax=Aduncisulcus paluster TaxID=2918883 RepID=A0ABQ5JZ19_9EUKA|nr:chromosome segregation protein [Aduncisulcus paluster]
MSDSTQKMQQEIPLDGSNILIEDDGDGGFDFAELDESGELDFSQMFPDEVKAGENPILPLSPTTKQTKKEAHNDPKDEVLVPDINPPKPSDLITSSPLKRSYTENIVHNIELEHTESGLDLLSEDHEHMGHYSQELLTADLEASDAAWPSKPASRWTDQDVSNAVMQAEKRGEERARKKFLSAAERRMRAELLLRMKEEVRQQLITDLEPGVRLNIVSYLPEDQRKLLIENEVSKRVRSIEIKLRDKLTKSIRAEEQKNADERIQSEVSKQAREAVSKEKDKARRMLAEAERRMKELKGREDLDKQVKLLQKRLSDAQTRKEREVASAKSNVVNLKKKVENLKSELAKRASRIAELEGLVEEKEGKIVSSEELIQHLHERVQTISAQMESIQDQNDRLDAALQLREDELIRVKSARAQALVKSLQSSPSRSRSQQQQQLGQGGPAGSVYLQKAYPSSPGSTRALLTAGVATSPSSASILQSPPISPSFVRKNSSSGVEKSPGAPAASLSGTHSKKLTASGSLRRSQSMQSHAGFTHLHAPRMPSPSASRATDNPSSHIHSHFIHEKEAHNVFLSTPPIILPQDETGHRLGVVTRKLFALWDDIEESFVRRNKLISFVRDCVAANRCGTALKTCLKEYKRIVSVKESVGVLINQIRKREDLRERVVGIRQGSGSTAFGEEDVSEDLATMSTEVWKMLNDHKTRTGSSIKYRGYDYLELMKSEREKEGV